MRSAARHSSTEWDPTESPAPSSSPNRLAYSATLHCLAGCSIGEVLGMVIGTALGWANLPTMGLAILLAFIFGYAFTLVPLFKAGLAAGAAFRLALASDTISITVMEIIDNLIMVIIPGAMDAHLTEPLFWGSLMAALLIAGVIAFPINRWLILRGRGHALIHQHHGARGSGPIRAEHSATRHHH